MSTPKIEEQIHSFDDVLCVIANEERFKVRLGVGASAFGSLKAAEVVSEMWNVGWAAKDGAALATLPGVATLLAPSSIWAALGLASAATPVGWVIGAGAAAGGLYYGVNRAFKTYYGSRVDEVPRFLNSPIDVLGASFLDLVGSLAMKVAVIDGNIDPLEKKVISEYFTDEWGFDLDYTAHALDLLEQNVDKQRVSEMATTLAEFARTNPDCDFAKVQKGLTELLTEIAEADGVLDEREEMAIERITSALETEVSTMQAIKRTLSTPVEGAASAANWVADKVWSRGKPEKPE